MKSSLITVILVLLSGFCVYGQTEEVSFDEDLLSTLEHKAMVSNRYIALYFNAPSCPVCINMEEGPLQDESVNQYISKYYVFEKINGVTDFNGIELAQKFNLLYYPSIVILNSSGTMMELLEGYASASILISTLQKWRGKRNAPF